MQAVKPPKILVIIKFSFKILVSIEFQLISLHVDEKIDLTFFKMTITSDNRCKPILNARHNYHPYHS